MIVKELKIKNFRQFDSQKIEFKKPWTIIVAPNAKGKSSIIEALYTMSHGDSPWESNNSNLIKIPKNKKESESSYEKLEKSTSRIEVEIETEDELSTIAIILKSNGNSTTKQYEIEGSTTNKQKFTRSFSSVLFGPNLIDILMYEPSQRRKFLDSYAAKLDPHYYRVITDYNKVLRQRNSQLKAILAQKRSQDEGDRSLQYWTDQLITLGSDVFHARGKVVLAINTSADEYPATISYEPSIHFFDSEELAELEDIREIFSQRLLETREKERYAGVTLIGPHRDDWFLARSGTNLNTFGSRGELRMAIIDVLMRLSELLAKEYDGAPLLLLDDISSELDKDNVAKLFRETIPAEQQAVITTTAQSNIPKEIAEKSHIVRL